MVALSGSVPTIFQFPVQQKEIAAFWSYDKKPSFIGSGRVGWLNQSRCQQVCEAPNGLEWAQCWEENQSLCLNHEQRKRKR